jgi:hypothetical protein
MKKLIILLLLTGGLVTGLHAQKYLTKTGVIEIFSETSLFVIEAKNQQVACILNAENGDVVTSTLVRSFKFREALVEEHFNENYMESHLYPKAQFKGKIINFSSVDLSKDGSYPVTIEGSLTMHGETNPVTTKGTLVVKSGTVTATAEMIISLEQYKIKVEEQYKDRINDKIRLAIHFELKPM